MKIDSEWTTVEKCDTILGMNWSFGILFFFFASRRDVRYDSRVWIWIEGME